MAIIEDIDCRDVALFAEGLPEKVCGYFFGDFAQCDRDGFPALPGQPYGLRGGMMRSCTLWCDW